MAQTAQIEALSAPRPKSSARRLKIGVVIAYLEGRETLCAKNLYPRSHLWGSDAMAEAGWDVTYLRPRDTAFNRFLRALNRWSGGRLGNLDFDFEAICNARNFDVIYVGDGRLLLSQLLRAVGCLKSKVMQWEYVPPKDQQWWRFRSLWHRPFFARGVDGYLCLTEATARAFRELDPRTSARAIQWAPDTIMFPGSDRDGDFFLACGRTNRDYQTLIAAAAKVNFPIVLLIARDLVQGLTIPPNVRFVAGPKDGGTHKGIPYPELIFDWYANARAVLIPRKDIPTDTSGFTNLLEALAMHRPVLITRTGKLDLDVEKAGVGFLVEPNNPDDWAQKMTRLWNDSALRAQMREAAREQIESFYNLRRFGADTVAFVNEVAAR